MIASSFSTYVSSIWSGKRFFPQQNTTKTLQTIKISISKKIIFTKQFVNIYKDIKLDICRYIYIYMYINHRSSLWTKENTYNNEIKHIKKENNESINNLYRKIYTSTARDRRIFLEILKLLQDPFRSHWTNKSSKSTRSAQKSHD